MVIIKWSEKVEGSEYNIYLPLCGGLYKEEDDSLVTWPGTNPDASKNCFTWSKENNDWIILGYQYNEEFKNCRGPIHNGHLRSQNVHRTFKKRRHALSIQDLLGLMTLLWKEIQ